MIQHLDGAIDVSVVVGEFQPHRIDVMPLPSIDARKSLIKCHNRVAVRRQCRLIESIDEVRQHHVRPSRRSGAKRHQPFGKLNGVRHTLPAGPCIQISGSLAFITDETRRIVYLLDEVAQLGHREQQRRLDDLGSATVQACFEFVEHLAGRCSDGIGLPIVDETAEGQGISHIVLQFDLPSASSGADLQEISHPGISLGQRYDEIA